MTLLKQLLADLPGPQFKRMIYYSADLTEANTIAERVRELRIGSVRFVLELSRTEPRPPDGSPKQAAYDVLVGALNEVLQKLAEMPPIERSGD